VKQRYVSLSSSEHTLKFLGSLALPYLPLAAYAAYRLKDATARCCWQAALVYTLYYLTVAPVMNVFSRYQWPVLVLLTYASLPTFQKLGEGIALPASTRHRGLAATALLLAALVNAHSARAALHLSKRAGTAERNLIALGKSLAQDRQEDRWMAYCDAGAVCYFSDWNSYDTMGLNTRQIAIGSVKPAQVYGYRHTELVMLNRGDAEPTGPCWPSARDCDALEAQLGRLGYQCASRVPILTEDARPRWVVVLYARTAPGARPLLQGVRLASETFPPIELLTKLAASEPPAPRRACVRTPPPPGRLAAARSPGITPRS
jgi:hypothetical protein